MVSIIIPAYNVQSYISDTIESIISQSYKNWELLIIDDGSTDNTKRVIEKYVELDNRIKYIYQQNKGCSAAKNLGYNLAKGKFIQYLDADDLLNSVKLEEQVSALQLDFFKVAVCRTIAFDDYQIKEKGVEIDTEFLFDSNKPFKFLMNLYGANGNMGMIQPNSFLISKQLADKIGAFDLSISPSPDEDGEYFCRAILASSGIVYTKNGINYYRRRSISGQSLSQQYSYLHAKGALRSLVLITKHLLEYNSMEKLLIQNVMSIHYAGIIYRYYKFKDICNEAETNIYNLEQKKIPIVGGKRFKNVANIIGFKVTISIKRWCGKFLTKFSL